MRHIIIKNINNYSDNLLDNFNVISPKKEKLAKIKDKKNKNLSILGEYILAKLLKKYYKINYQNLIIKYNDNNKPYINNYKIYYNISHSHDYVCVITSNYECGIDIEKIRKVDLNVIKSFATLKEQKYINNSYKRLFEIYCLKEAYLKMNGFKLADINNVVFIITKKKIICSDSKVKCKLIYHKNYIVAICEKASKNS